MSPPPRRIAIRYLPGQGETDRVLPELVATLQGGGVEVATLAVYQSDPSGDPVKAAAAIELLTAQDLVVSLGGDGTLLSTARLVAGSGVPILGLNLKGLGFLTATRADNYRAAVEAILAGTLEYETRHMLDVAVGSARTPHPFAALNEVAIMRGAPAHMVQLEVHLNDAFLTSMEADGLIISTPTGSTAYNLAGGGSILWPELDVIALTPIMPHALTIRPIVVPRDTVIEVVGMPSTRGTIHLGIDGRTRALDMGDARVEVRHSDKVTRLARLGGTSFGDILREKLEWGGRLRPE